MEVADKIFSPSYEGMHKYQGEWHIEINKLFPGYVFIQSENADQLETYLEHLSGTVTPVQIGGGFYPIRTEEQAFLMEMLDTDDCVRYSLNWLSSEDRYPAKRIMSARSTATSALQI